MNVRQRAAIVALFAALTCGLLGSSVSQIPPGPLDRAGAALAGKLPYLALVFTASCWWQVLVSFGVAAIALALIVPAWRGRVLFAIPTTLLAWLASDHLKDSFVRERPPYWTLIHETSWSYPSGHAMFAVVVYGLWAYYLATSGAPRPVRVLLATAAGLWAVGILWSRLALGAHYVTDVIGGVLFGIAVLATAAAIAGRIPSIDRRDPVNV